MGKIIGANKKVILEIQEKIKDKNIVIVCIGTDLHVWDSLGPMVGTMLPKANISFDNDIYIYGELDEPIHAKNCNEVIKDIKENHSSDVIIAVDIATTYNPHKYMEINVKHGPVKPGAGIGNNKLDSVGDYSIIFYVLESQLNDKRIRMPFNGAIDVVILLKAIIERGFIRDEY